MLRFARAEPNRILIVRLGSIGDVARVLPMLHGLRLRFPDAEIDWVVQKRAVDLLEGHPHLDHVFVVPFRRWQKLLSGEAWCLRRRMRARDYDLVLDFQGTLKGALAGFLAGGRAVRVGWTPWHAEEATWLLSHGHRAPRSKRVNRHARFRCLVDWLDVPDVPGVPPDFEDAEIETVERFLAGLPDRRGPRIFVFPGTSPPGRHRRWKLERLMCALELIGDQARATLLIGWGPAEEEIAREVAAGVKGTVLIPPTTIKELMILMSRCDLYLGMHTGPMHLAALMGTPVVAVFGDRSDPRIHAPADHLESRVIAHPEARQLSAWQRRGLGPFEGPEPEEVAEATLEMLVRGKRTAR